jgi:putative endonuclease
VLDKAYFVYIVASQNRVLYTGFTGKLGTRMWQHKTRTFSGFSCRYGCDRLVWMEMHPDPHAAIAREKQIKGWARKKKVALVQEANPFWVDLAAEWFDPEEVEAAKQRNLGQSQAPPAMSS